MTSEMMYGSWSLRIDNSKPTVKALVDIPVNDAKGDITTPVLVNSGNDNTLVNLQVQFEDSEKDTKYWKKATGWLVQPDIVVTTGDTTFDHVYGRGKAVVVHAYVGYNGKKSIDDPSVQVRNGVQVVTPKDWIDGDNDRRKDIAFIKLNQPFKDITPFRYDAMSGVGHPALGVVGYPGDNDNDKAAQIYERWNGETYALAKGSEVQTYVKVRPENSLKGLMKAINGDGTSVITVDGIDYIHVLDQKSS